MNYSNFPKLSLTFPNSLQLSPAFSNLPLPSSAFFSLLQPSEPSENGPQGDPGNPRKPYETVRQGDCLWILVVFSEKVIKRNKKY